MWPNLQKAANLVSFTEEIMNNFIFVYIVCRLKSETWGEQWTVDSGQCVVIVTLHFYATVGNVVFCPSIFNHDKIFVWNSKISLH